MIPMLDTSQISFSSLFSNENPTEIEIGCGKAKFIIDRAEQNPNINFICFDRIWKFARVGEARAKKRDLKNILFFKIEAVQFLKEVVPDESIHMFHIYFPDPWPKRKYHKRRLINEDFLDLLSKKTISNGTTQIATDNTDYYKQIKKSLEKSLVWVLQKESVNDRILKGNEKTNYELKYEDEGRTLHYLELTKR